MSNGTMPNTVLSLAGKTVVLGVGGSVSAYKAADLCSKLVQEGATVLPILTSGATRFVAAATFWGLASQPVATDVWETPFGQTEIAHLVYAERADVFVIAPASADLLARMASGVCDDMVTAALVANIHKPVLVAPAMNTDMWQHPSTQRNRRTLEGFGYQFIEPGVGRLAEGVVGAGRLAEPIEIVEHIRQTIAHGGDKPRTIPATATSTTPTVNTPAPPPKNDLAGVKILVTAGPTREPIDPVRYISNRSSGKMGYALAEEAASRGADVVLVSGPTHIAPPTGIHFDLVNTAQEMRDRCVLYNNEAHVVLAAAAVADYAPIQAATHKLKKTGEDAQHRTLLLEATPDILSEIGSRKRAGQILIGFAAETENVEPNAQRKLREKNLDLIVANDVTQPGAGFDGDTNIVTLIARHAEPLNLPQMTKRAVAAHICDWIVARRRESAPTEKR